MKRKLTLCLILMAGALTSAQAMEANSLFQGLISFRDGPDPAGKTPVYWATSKTLHHVQSPRAAERKFGANWVAQIRWCGDAAGRPSPGECADIYANFRHGQPISETTQDLLHP